MINTLAPRFETRIDGYQSTREAMISLLNQQLADTMDLYTQIKQAHWNMQGIHFMTLRLLFDSLAETLLRCADMIAERATALGGVARGTARMAAASSRLNDLPLETTDGKALVIAIAERFAEYADSIRSAIDEAADRNDAATACLMTRISREVDKSLWFVETHVQG